MVRRTRVNDMIRLSPLRVIGAENEQYGIIELKEAMQLARDAGLDLVEVSPESRPPVCKIMDYGRYKYQLSKKERKASSGSKKTELKEIRLGRSMRIDPHDVATRLKQARSFLMDGHKVQFVQPFQGREMQHRQLGFTRMREIEEKFVDIAKVEVPPRFVGRRMTMILAPEKAKIQAIRRAQESAKKAAEPNQQVAEVDRPEQAAASPNVGDDPVVVETTAPGGAEPPDQVEEPQSAAAENINPPATVPSEAG